MEIRAYAPDDPRFLQILRRGQAQDDEVGERVAAIVKDVARRGDEALAEYTRRFDGVDIPPEKLRVSPAEFDAARAAVDPEFLTALALARVNIRRFHEYQRRQGYIHDDGDGVRLAKQIRPIASVGVYCPGGTAPLFSTLLMNVIPAQIAGVRSIAAAMPPGPDGAVDPHLLVAAQLLDLDVVYKMGGAQAIAAFAHGTATVGRVDKIVGPGNAYVARAKREVYGLVGIDGVAGPSEIVVIADERAPARYVAADLLSQVEHGSGYEAGVVLTDSHPLAVAVGIELSRQLEGNPRADKARAALERFGAVFVCRDLREAVAAANAIAPEHLELLTDRAHELLPEVDNAGAVFIGPWSPEPVGDYFAGTNHVLPTAGAARFSSSLGVADFVKDISVVEYSAARLRKAGRHIVRLAETEGLAAHAAAVRARLVDLGE